MGPGLVREVGVRGIGLALGLGRGLGFNRVKGRAGCFLGRGSTSEGQ